MSRVRALSPAAPADAEEWEVVPQRTTAQKPAVTLGLRPGRPGGQTRLFVAVAADVCAQLGWLVGTRLGLAVGQGRRSGWLRIAPSGAGSGYALRSLGRSRKGGGGGVMHMMLQPPEAIADFEADKMAAEHQVAGDALLVRVPWDFTQAEDGSYD